MNKPKHVELKVLDMFYCLNYLAGLEAIEQKLEYTHGCHFSEYGENTIKGRLINLIKRDQYGNQDFSNDSFYRWTDVASSPEDPDIKMFLEHFGDSVNRGECSDDDFILFYVCW